LVKVNVTLCSVSVRDHVERHDVHWVIFGLLELLTGG
jgi:hypothetical protein